MARLVKSSNAEGGVVFYDGPSMFDGQRIVGVALLSSGNAKTGNLVQTTLFRPDRNTNVARKDGSDESVCADCEQRPLAYRLSGCGGGCYVSAQFLGTVWKNFYEKNAYQPVPPERLVEVLNGRFLRVGTYGDPAAVPPEVWLAMLQHVPLWTGYTRQWRRGDNWPIPETQAEFERRTDLMKQFCMASVFDPLEYGEAVDAGWRTFRTRPPVLGRSRYRRWNKKKNKMGRWVYPPNYFKHRDANSRYWQQSIQYWPEPFTEDALPRSGLLPGEGICRATDEWSALGKELREAGHAHATRARFKKLHCLECKMCSGTSGFGAGKINLAIRSHGTNVLRTPTIEGLSGLGDLGDGDCMEPRIQYGCFGPDPEFYW